MTDKTQETQKFSVIKINVQDHLLVKSLSKILFSPTFRDSQSGSFLLSTVSSVLLLHQLPGKALSRASISPFLLITHSLAPRSWPGSPSNLSTGYHWITTSQLGSIKSYTLKKIFRRQNIKNLAFQGTNKYVLPQNGAHKAEFVGSVPMRYRTVQFLLDQDCDGCSQVSPGGSGRREVEESRQQVGHQEALLSVQRTACPSVLFVFLCSGILFH